MKSWLPFAISPLVRPTKKNERFISLTFFNVLILVERLDCVFLRETPEGIDEMCAEVRVDVGGSELCRSLSVDCPVGEIADDPLPLWIFPTPARVLNSLSLDKDVLQFLILVKRGWNVYKKTKVGCCCCFEVNWAQAYTKESSENERTRITEMSES